MAGLNHGDATLKTLEYEYRVPDVFRKHPIPDYLTAEQMVQAVFWLWGRWNPHTQAAQELRFLFAHYEGDPDEHPHTMQDSRG